MPPQPDSPSLEALVLAPFGRDAPIAAELLNKEGLRARVVTSLSEIEARLAGDDLCGAVLIAQEALTIEGAQSLKDALARQESWSDLPIILMVSEKERTISGTSILEVFATSGSITILERPFRVMTLVSAVRVALRARKKQYDVRELLREQKIYAEGQTRAVHQRDDFLSIASHELKTPLTSLKLQVQMKLRALERGDAALLDPEKISRFLRFTANQIERLSHLVEDMLDVSRVDNGKLSLNRERVELGELVTEILSHFAAQFEAVGSAVDLDVRSPASGEWDRYRIEQVIANLFTNAIKYGSGKPVSIEVDRVGSSAVLRVTDRGIGIASDHQKRIFERFERAVPKDNVSGLGLGLFISRQILDLHDGSIEVESRGAEGSTFTVKLPVGESPDTTGSH